MTAIVSVDQTIQEWGNGLAVRITAKVAKSRSLHPRTTDQSGGG